MAIDLNAAKASKSSTSRQTVNDSGVVASKDLATTTAQVIRGQVAQASKLVDTLAEQQERVSDHLSDRLAEVLNPHALWETTCAKTLEKLGVQEDVAPFEILAIDLPPISPIAERYLQRSRSYGQRASISSSSPSASGELPAVQRTVDLPKVSQ